MGKGQFLEQVWTVTLLGKEKQSKKPETPSLSPGAAFCVSNLKTKVRIKKCGRENGPKFFFFFFFALKSNDNRSFKKISLTFEKTESFKILGNVKY